MLGPCCVWWDSCQQAASYSCVWRVITQWFVLLERISSLRKYAQFNCYFFLIEPCLWRIALGSKTILLSTDAVTIVLFKVLGAVANRPFDPSLSEEDRIIDVGDVSTPCSAYSSSHVAHCTSGISGDRTVCCCCAGQCSYWICRGHDSCLHHSLLWTCSWWVPTSSYLHMYM